MEMGKGVKGRMIGADQTQYRSNILMTLLYEASCQVSEMRDQWNFSTITYTNQIIVDNHKKNA